jgi:hypothetical protein
LAVNIPTEFITIWKTKELRQKYFGLKHHEWRHILGRSTRAIEDSRSIPAARPIHLEQLGKGEK